MIYIPRLTAPEKNNPYYNTKSVGGYSNCIIGNYPMGADKKDRIGLQGLNTLPNCVGYAFGRFNEIGQYGKFKYSWGGNACDILNKAKNTGMKISSAPQVGALICWKGGSGDGHIAVVEKIISNTEIIISQSGWSYKGATGVWSATHKLGVDGNWLEGGDYNWMKNKYQFQGFILHPDVEGEETVTQDEFNKMMDNYIQQLTNKSVASWAAESVQWMSDKGYMVGDNGNLMPQRFINRQELATVLKRIIDTNNMGVNCPCMQNNHKQ